MDAGVREDKEKMISDARKLYASYDYNAKRQQNNFRRYQTTLLLLTLATTLLATLQTIASLWIAAHPAAKTPAAGNFFQFLEPQSSWGHALTVALVLLTATTSGLLSGLSHFKPGEKWLALRGGAQLINREIYTYLMQAGDYRNHPGQALLYHKLNAIAVGLTDIILHEARQTPKANAADDAQESDVELFPMTPAQYLELRLADQMGYYRSKIGRLNTQAQWLHGASIVASTAGTVLALLHLSIGIPFTAAVATACISFLQQRQIEILLAQYNKSCNSLARVESWWRNELTDAEREQADNRDKLVSLTEDILSAELTSWAQKLSEAMAKMETPPTVEEKAASATSAHVLHAPEAEAVVRSKVHIA